MTQDLSQYLERIRDQARLDHSDEPEVMIELEAHIEDKLRELKEAGLTDEEAARTCMWQMGSIKSLARQIYEAYSQGSWKHVWLASLPHFLFGLFFVLDWWHYPQLLSIVLIVTLGTALYGWAHDKPTWAFSWLGYSLLPVMALGVLLLYLPTQWSFLGLIVYFPLALWWVYRMLVRTTKKDWLLSTLMLLPLPIMVGWFMAIAPSGKFNDASLERVNIYAPWIGLSFMMMAFTIGTFIRLRQRRLKVGLLAISGLLTLSVAIYLATGRLNCAAFLGPVMGLWAILLIPPLLERQLKNGRFSLFKHRDIKAGGLPSS